MKQTAATFGNTSQDERREDGADKVPRLGVNIEYATRSGCLSVGSSCALDVCWSWAFLGGWDGKRWEAEGGGGGWGGEILYL